MEWVRSGAVIGGETRGSEGYRRDAKGEVRRHIAVVVPGQKTASIGLENRKSRKGFPGSNPGPPAMLQRFNKTLGVTPERPWGRNGAVFGGMPSPAAGRRRNSVVS